MLAWVAGCSHMRWFIAGQIVNGATVTDLSPGVIAAYDAPFPDDAYQAGARQFPLLVPTSPDDPAAARNRAAWAALGEYDRPFLCAFSDSDPITGAAEPVLRGHVRGAQGEDHVTITGGGHFLQEDQGPRLAEVVVDFIATHPR